MKRLLLLCLLPALAFAQAVVNVPSGVAQTSQLTTTAPVDMYVTSTGTDNGVCSQSAPCLTVQAACGLIPPQVSHVVTVHIGAGTFAGCFLQGKRIMNASNTTKAGIRFQGTLQTATVATGTATGTLTSVTAASGVTRQVLTDSGQSWTSNDLKGKLFCLTSGASSGNCGVIVSNTSTAVTAMGLWGGPDSWNNGNTGATASVGNTYAIQDWGTTMAAGSGYQIPQNLLSSTQSVTSTSTSFYLADIIGGGQPSGSSIPAGVGLVDMSYLKFTNTNSVRTFGCSGGFAFYNNSITGSASGWQVARSAGQNVTGYANYFSTTGTGFSVSGGGVGISVIGNYSDAAGTFLSSSTGPAFASVNFSYNEIEATIGMKMSGGGFTDQSNGNHINCESRGSSTGVLVSTFGEGSGAATINFTTGTNAIDNCTTAVSATGINSSISFSGSTLNGSGNTTGFVVNNGAHVLLGTNNLTATGTYLSIDGRAISSTTLRQGNTKAAESLATGASYVESLGSGGYLVGDAIVPMNIGGLTPPTCDTTTIGAFYAAGGTPSKTCKCITTSGGAYQWAKIADDTGTVTTSGGSSTACP